MGPEKIFYECGGDPTLTLGFVENLLNLHYDTFVWDILFSTCCKEIVNNGTGDKVDHDSLIALLEYLQKRY